MASSSAPPPPSGGPAPPLYSALRALGWVVLALMLVSILYAGWISAENWSSIRV